MRRILLNGNWNLKFSGKEITDAKVPGSVYGTLLEKGLMEDPYFRDNELEALKLMDNDCEYSLKFHVRSLDIGKNTPKLVFKGVDTLADLWLNGVFIGSMNNMHRTWHFPVDGILKYDCENEIKVVIHSPVKFIKEENEKVYCGGSHEAMEGFPHLRKAHCMFGWDWGPRLPDMGIFREVYIEAEGASYIKGVYISQTHVKNQEGGTDVTLDFNIDAQNPAGCESLIYILDPQGRSLCFDGDSYTIKNAQLWWPNGYGEQPLYTVSVVLIDADGNMADSWTRRIGLRTMTINTDKDEWGECFAHEVNGVKIFAMGADYIPEDNILSRVTPERTRRLLEDAAKAHHNSIRVWGGGYYPDDFFYDICDELGLVVWQDCMFACASYELDDEFDANIRAEITDNVRRIRHHACLGLWCGNNEMETQTLDGCWKPSIKQRADYLKIFEYIIPQIIKEEDPQAFYWPSSPSSCGNFDNPWDENRGDAHYWDVWHGCKPFTDYRKYHFRYLSEFGFQAFPTMPTIESFTLPEDRNPFSRVMEMHQRNVAANGKIVNYLSATYLYPGSFERFVYLSQLLQAEAIRYGVEHFRRNRGRCMGAVVWQLNDIWPVASWSSIDYHEVKIFSPVLISCEEHGEVDQKPFCITEPREIEKSFRLNVSNETMEEVSGTISWELKTAEGKIIKKGSKKLRVPALSAVWTDKVDCGAIDVLNTYLTYSFRLAKGSSCPQVPEGTALFTAPKHFKFAKPHITAKVGNDSITITTDVFTKNVFIEAIGSDVRLEDNFFDMDPGTRTVRFAEGSAKRFRIMCVNTDDVVETGVF